MRRHHIDDQALAVLAVIGRPAYEVKETGLVKSECAVPAVEGRDRIACVAVVVAPFVHHQNRVILVLEIFKL